MNRFPSPQISSHGLPPKWEAWQDDRYAKLFIELSDYLTDPGLYGVGQSGAPRLLQLMLVSEYLHWLERQSHSIRQQIHNLGFKAKAGQCLVIASSSDDPRCGIFLVLLDEYQPRPLIEIMAKAAKTLPEGVYQLEASWRGASQTTANPLLTRMAYLGWGLADYQFNHFKQSKLAESIAPASPSHRLVRPALAEEAEATKSVVVELAGIQLIRDLINFPPNLITPKTLATIVSKLAALFQADCKVISGVKELQEQNFPLIAEVGKASAFPPHLIDLRWTPKPVLNPQQSSKPAQHKLTKLTLIGKGVTFDTGGINLKSSSNMRLMKKDMGGAAHTIGLAAMIMASGLALDLRLIIPAVENAVDGDFMRPLDIINSRKGLTIEIGDTDAEGRLILADALAYALEDDGDLPDYIVDMATLTGAARVALGTSLPALFTNDDDWAQELSQQGKKLGDPCWRLPLHEPYRHELKSKIADLNSAPSSGYGGAITAALFLDHFVRSGSRWAHIDLMAWNLADKPGFPEGGEAQMARTLFNWVKHKAQT